MNRLRLVECWGYSYLYVGRLRYEVFVVLWSLLVLFAQDEYGTAAYKTVELDTYLDDKAIQHRECEGHESELFLSYFPKGLT